MPTPRHRPRPAQDACLLGPWQEGGAAPAFVSRAVTVATFAELQQHVDAADGPTALLVRAAGGGALPGGGRALVVAKPNIVITSAASYDARGGPLKGPKLRVACGGARTLASIT